MTPVQLSAFIDLFEPMTASAANATSHSPFCDELPVDADDASSMRATQQASHVHQPPRFAPVSAHPSDLDTWPSSIMSRSTFSHTTAA
jgi:hypothetical protein